MQSDAVKRFLTYNLFTLTVHISVPFAFSRRNVPNAIAILRSFLLSYIPAIVAATPTLATIQAPRLTGAAVGTAPFFVLLLVLVLFALALLLVWPPALSVVEADADDVVPPPAVLMGVAVDAAAPLAVVEAAAESAPVVEKVEVGSWPAWALETMEEKLGSLNETMEPVQMNWLSLMVTALPMQHWLPGNREIEKSLLP